MRLAATIASAEMGLAAAVLLLGCVGCFGSRPEDQLPPEVRDRLSHVESTSLVELSQSPPLTLDQASTVAATQPQTQPAALTTHPSGTSAPTTAPAVVAIELSLAEVRAAALANNLDLQVELLNPRLAR